MAVTAQGSGTETAALSGTFTVTIASPGVFTKAAHGLVAGDQVTFTTTGALPTGLTVGTIYYVIAAGLTANDFQVSTAINGAAVNTSGTQSGTHTLYPEQALLDVAIAGTFQILVDKVAMLSGDTLELRVYSMVLTAGTRRVVYFERYTGAQSADDMIAISVPISNELTDAGALRFTLKQTAGTARAFPWKVLKFA